MLHRRTACQRRSDKSGQSKTRLGDPCGLPSGHHKIRATAEFLSFSLLPKRCRRTTEFGQRKSRRFFRFLRHQFRAAVRLVFWSGSFIAMEPSSKREPIVSSKLSTESFIRELKSSRSVNFGLLAVLSTIIPCRATLLLWSMAFGHAPISPTRERASSLTVSVTKRTWLGGCARDQTRWFFSVRWLHFRIASSLRHTIPTTRQPDTNHSFYRCELRRIRRQSSADSLSRKHAGPNGVSACERNLCKYMKTW